MSLSTNSHFEKAGDIPGTCNLKEAYLSFWKVELEKSLHLLMKKKMALWPQLVSSKKYSVPYVPDSATF